jgi:hypothetical protein
MTVNRSHLAAWRIGADARKRVSEAFELIVWDATEVPYGRQRDQGGLGEQDRALRRVLVLVDLPIRPLASEFR